MVDPGPPPHEPAASESPGARLQRQVRGRLPSDRVDVLDGPERCAVVHPETGAELVEILLAARAEGLRLHHERCRDLARGPWASLDLSRLSRILDLDGRSRIVSVQSGVTLGTLERWLRVHDTTLGWFAPAQEKLTVAEALQYATPSGPSPIYGDPLASVRGYRAVLPDGGEARTPTGPRRATGPDLLGLLRGGFCFGVLTRVVLAVHPRPRAELTWTAEAADPEPLLKIAGLEASGPRPPNHLLLRALRGRGSRRRRDRWVLQLIWHRIFDGALAFGNRARFRGLTAHMRRDEPPTTGLDLLLPARGAVGGRFLQPLAPGLLDAIASSRTTWILAWRSGHELWLWSEPGSTPPETDPVRALLEGRRDRAAAAIGPLQTSLRAAVEALESPASTEDSG